VSTSRNRFNVEKTFTLEHSTLQCFRNVLSTFCAVWGNYFACKVVSRERECSRNPANHPPRAVPLAGRRSWLCVSTHVHARTKRGRLARSGSPVGCTYIAQSRNARATGFDRTCCIYRRRARCIYVTGHRPRITRTQFAHIKPITCFGRIIREFCDCISDALFNFPP